MAILFPWGTDSTTGIAATNAKQVLININTEFHNDPDAVLAYINANVAAVQKMFAV